MRTAPKFLFELSEREALLIRDAVFIANGTHDVNLLVRLAQFVVDCQQVPLTETELEILAERAVGPHDPKDKDYVSFCFPPGQQRREFVECDPDPENASGRG